MSTEQPFEVKSSGIITPPDLTINFSYKERTLELHIPYEQFFTVVEILNDYLNSKGINSYLKDKTSQAAIE